MNHSITLRNTAEGHEVFTKAWNWAKARLSAGKPVRLSIGEEQRTLPQNDHIQRLVRSIGGLIGNKDHDNLRVLLVEQWRFETNKPPIHAKSFDGSRWIDVSNRSSGLDKSAGSEFIEWLQAKEAELQS